MQLIPTGFDGHVLNNGTDYDAWFERGVRSYAIQLTQTGRRNSWSLIDSISRDGATLALHVALKSGAGTSPVTFAEHVKAWFDASVTTLRFLTVTGDDARTPLRIAVQVLNVAHSGDNPNQLDITLYAPRPWFETANPTVLTNPSTAANTGNIAVTPSVALTTTHHVARQRWTVTGSGTGGGHRNYPVKLAISDAALTAANAYVTVNGAPVPFTVYAAGTGSSYLWVRVDTASDGTTPTTVDVVYGAGIANVIAGTLNDGGMEWSNTSCDNSTWYYDDLSISSKLALPGCWRAGATGLSGGGSGTYDILAEASTDITFVRYGDGSGTNTADSMVLALGGASASALTQVARVTTGHGAPVVTVATTVNGSGGANEQQTITLTNANGGGFPLTFGGQSTSSINYNATTADVKSALEALSTIGAGNVKVSGGPLPTALVTVEFIGALALANQPQMTADATYLTGGGVQSFVKYKNASSIRDIYIWQETANATVSTSLLMTGAVQIAMGIEHTNATPNMSAACNFAKNSGSSWQLTLGNTPTVTWVSTQNMDSYTGVLTIGATVITFTNYITEDGTLTIAEGDRGWSAVSSVANAMVYGPDNALALSDADRWLLVAAGANATSNTCTGATTVLSFRSGYV